MLPSINTVNITIYRPPSCPFNLFVDAMNKIEDWLLYLEKLNIRPIVLFNGDFNFPFMGTWTEDKITKILDLYSTRTENGSQIASDNLQALELINFSSNNFLSQVVSDPTRKNNTLDYIFTNEPDAIFNQEVIINSLISDHNLLEVSTTIPLHSDISMVRENIYSSSVMEYDLLAVTEEEWLKLSESLNENCENLYEEDLDKLAEAFLKKVDSTVQSIIPHRKYGTKRSVDMNGKVFKSNNLIL